MFVQPALLVCIFSGKQTYRLCSNLGCQVLDSVAFPVLHLRYQRSPAIIIHSINLDMVVSIFQVIFRYRCGQTELKKVTKI